MRSQTEPARFIYLRPAEGGGAQISDLAAPGFGCEGVPTPKRRSCVAEADATERALSGRSDGIVAFRLYSFTK